MTIIYANGFEDGLDALLPDGAMMTTRSGAGRRGGTAYGRILTGAGASTQNLTLPANFSTLFLAFAWKTNATSALDRYIVELYESATKHIGIYANADGSISVHRNTTTIGTSAPGVLNTAGEYLQLQIKVVISDTVGSVEIRLNGSETPIIALSNVDTRNAGTGVVNTIRLTSYSTSSGGDLASLFDDLVVWDTTGSVNNTWLGDVRVDSYMPSGDGDTTTMAPSTGTAHWQLVDEVPASDTDYVSSASVGALDLFQMADMAHTPATVHGVVAVAQMLKSDAGAREVGITLKSGATESVGSNIALGTGSTKYQRVIETDPNGGVAWTKAAIDALQVGVKVTV